MSIVGSNALAGASGQSTGGGGGGGSGYQITRSLRIDDTSNATLTRTPSTAGNRKTWTLSFWIKRTEIGGNQLLFNAGNTSNGDHSVMRLNGDMFQMYQYGHNGDTTAWSGGNGSQLRTSAKFRDPSAWMHIVVAMDTTQATQSDRLKYYINGVLQTEFDSTSYPAQDSNPGYWNAADLHCWGDQVQSTSVSGSADYYLAEVHMVDGQALAATDFGEYDSNNVWQPKEYSGTYGPSAVSYGDNNQITIDSGNYYLNNQDGPNAFDGNSSTYIDCRLGSGSNNTTNIIFQPTGGIANVTKIRVNSNYADAYRINNGSWTNFSSGGSYTQIYSGSAFTLTKLEIRRTSNSGSNYGHRVTAYEINDSELVDIANSGGTGFYLDFSDNSSNSALGTDSSGASNNWTANNITAVATGTNYADYVYAGGSTYSSTETGTNYFTGAGSNANLFDGNVNSQVGGTTASNSWVYFRPATAITGVTSLRIYGAYNGVTKVNGTDYDESPTWSSTAQWVSVPSPPSSITEIAVSGTGGYASRISAIEVNGTILVDVPGKDQDSLLDSPTNYDDGTNVGGNYCVLNPLDKRDSPTYSNGNLQVTGSGAAHCVGRSTFGVSSGRWYWEVLINSAIDSTYYPSPGICSMDTSVPNQLGDGTSGHAYMANGQKYTSGSLSSYGAAFTQGDTIGFALDMDAGTLVAYKNGTSQGTMATGLTGSWSPSWNQYQSTSLVYNFGQRGFAHTPPSNHLALVTTNLSNPTISDGSTAMDAIAYTGNGGSKTISGVGFSPDLIWTKCRNQARSHYLMDLVRGISKYSISEQTSAEGTNTTNRILSVTSDGWTLGTNNGFNGNNDTYIAWAWAAGSSTVSNTDGSITSQVRANASTGFSIVSYTGNGTLNATVGHGLNAAPTFRITKRRDGTDNWVVNTTAIDGSHDYAHLNLTNAFSHDGVNSPSSSVFSVGTHSSVNTNGNTYISYCFTPISQYSSFGSYEGNNSSDGPFVFTGMRPRWILIKNADSTAAWAIYDTARDDVNAAEKRLFPNLSSAESDASSNALDILSNGFKIRSTGNVFNSNSTTYLYAAFAEHPLSLNGGIAR